MPLAATGTESADPSANGIRTPRRRRSRGRRPRGSMAGAAAGYPEAPAAAGAEDGTEADDHDHDDHEEMEDDTAHAEGSDAGHEPRPAADQSTSAHADSGQEAPGGSADRAPSAPERPFSLFSWIRRDVAAPSSPAADPSKEDRED